MATDSTDLEIKMIVDYYNSFVKNKIFEANQYTNLFDCKENDIVSISIKITKNAIFHKAININYSIYNITKNIKHPDKSCFYYSHKGFINFIEHKFKKI
ncbi:MAG: hypothetical protein AABY22_26655 [Nanoarchaeota archaeon]